VIITHRTVGAFRENTYLVVDEESGSGVLIDPGAEGETVIEMVRRSGADLQAIWLTHAHVDHVGAVAAVRRTWDVPIYLHPLDEPLYQHAGRAAQAYGLPFEEPPAVDRALADGDRLRVGTLTFDVFHAPGHAPGLVVFHGHGVALAGDLIFAGSIGRTDLPLSNPAQMADSLERFAALADPLTIYPGHGPATTLERERRTNPFLTGDARVLGA
jgi:glyoxylase-like metal-dependent hydrolase (beta-lactamase superfamily II)